MTNLLRTGLLFTGGLDSTAAATMLVASGVRPYLFQVDEGLPQHVKSGRLVARKLGLEDRHHVIDASTIFPRLHFDDHERGVINGLDYECGHFMIIMSLCLAFAEKYNVAVLGTGCEFSVFGLSETDTALQDLKTEIGNVGDTTTGFRRDVMSLYNNHYRTQFVHCDLFMHLTKVNAVVLGAKLGAPFDLTCSCRNTDLEVPKRKVLHCGRASCRTCNERKAVFRLAGVPDPSNYVETSHLSKDYLEQAAACYEESITG